MMFLLSLCSMVENNKKIHQAFPLNTTDCDLSHFIYFSFQPIPSIFFLIIIFFSVAC